MHWKRTWNFTGSGIQNGKEDIPAHWHGAIELMYILNGVGTILIEGKEYKMIAGEFIVVDSNQIHEARCARASMMIVIHFSRSAMIQIEPNLEKYRISCRRSELLRTNLEDYFQICDLLKKLPPLYVNQPLGYRLERQAIALQIMAKLLFAFSYPKTAITLREDDTRLDYYQKAKENEQIMNGTRDMQPGAPAVSAQPAPEAAPAPTPNDLARPTIPEKKE